MKNITLKQPDITMKDHLIKLRDAHFNNGEYQLMGCSQMEKYESIEDWLVFEESCRNKHTLKDEWFVLLHLPYSMVMRII